MNRPRATWYPLAGLLFLSLATAVSAQPAARVLEVSAGGVSRDHAVFQVDWSGGSVAAVEELSADGKPVRALDFQMEAGEPLRLWVRWAGEFPAGEKRRIRVTPGERPKNENADVAVLRGEGWLKVVIGGREAITYHDAPVPVPEGVPLHNPKYRREVFARSAYIHPILTPQGRAVTEDFPADHTHHKGLWMPWTKTKFSGRDVDFWNLGDEKGTVRFKSFGPAQSGAVFGGFSALHEHVAFQPEQVVLNEKWEVRVHDLALPGRLVRVLDLISTQRCATDQPLELPEYRYGGLGYRGPASWTDDAHQVLSSEGKTKKDGHATRARWCAYGGPVDGQPATVVLFSHPGNFRHPEPMRIWDKGGSFFNWAPSQLGDWAIEPGKDHVWRYRFVIYDGPIDADLAERLWRDWAEPVGVREVEFR